MANNKRYILILSVLLIIILLINKYAFGKTYEFIRMDEYSFDDNKRAKVLDDCRKAYKGFLSKEQDDISELLDIIKVSQLSDYLLYKSKISSAVYYDLLRTMLLPDKRQTLKEKNAYVNELNSYMVRKKKTGLIKNKYEVSQPVVYKKNGMNLAYALVIKKYADNAEYIRYNFQKEDEKWYYLDKETVRNNFEYSLQ